MGIFHDKMQPTVIVVMLQLEEGFFSTIRCVVKTAMTCGKTSLYGPNVLALAMSECLISTMRSPFHLAGSIFVPVENWKNSQAGAIFYDVNRNSLGGFSCVQLNLRLCVNIGSQEERKASEKLSTVSLLMFLFLAS